LILLTNFFKKSSKHHLNPDSVANCRGFVFSSFARPGHTLEENTVPIMLNAPYFIEIDYDYCAAGPPIFSRPDGFLPYPVDGHDA
jgi:hypothetical protein